MRILYVDPSLRATLGHHFNVAKALVAALKRDGHEVRLLCSKHAAPVIEGEKLFQYTVYEDMFYDPTTNSGARALKSSTHCHAADIVAAIAQFNPDLIYAHSVGASICEGIMRAVDLVYSQGCKPVFVAEFGFPSDDRNGNYYGAQLKLMHARLKANQPKLLQNFSPISVCHDTSALLSKRVRFSVGTMPSPYSTQGSKKEAGNLTASRTIGCLGHQNVDKGIYLVPDIIDRLSGAEKPIEFTVQVQADTARATVAKLRSTSKPGISVNVVDSNLNESEYRDLLLKMDIVLLPYNPARYTSAISGICYEALAQGSVIVAPMHSTIGKIITRYQPNARLFDAWTTESIAHALEETIQNHDTLSHDARAGSVDYRSENGPEAYSKALAMLVKRNGADQRVADRKVAWKRIKWMLQSWPYRLERSILVLKRRANTLKSRLLARQI